MKWVPLTKRHGQPDAQTLHQYPGAPAPTLSLCKSWYWLTVSVGLFLVSLVLPTMPSMGQGTGAWCSCNEFIYLNEPGTSQVHKFKVESNGSLTEVSVAGNPWYPGSSTSQLPSPHGLGTDINGRLYIGESGFPNSHIRQLTTTGTITATTTFNLLVDDWNQNTFSIGNTLYINADRGPKAYDLCTGNYLGQVCLNNAAGTQQVAGQNLWGLSYNAKTGMVYATSRYRSASIPSANWSNVWAFTKTQLESALATGSCINPIITEGSSATVQAGEHLMPNLAGDVFGIVGDNQKNFYVVKWSTTDPRGAGSYILKYDAQGGFLTQSEFSAVTGSAAGAIGITWSESTNKLFVSNLSGAATEDCISAFDASTLTYTGTAVPNPVTGGGGSKAIGIIKECCPVVNTVTIDTTLCGDVLNKQIFLQELLKCEGIIGEGNWVADPNNVGVTYDDCSKTIRITASNACAKFRLQNVGGTCNDFTINVNIDAGNVVAAVIAGDQTVCPDTGDPALLTIVTPPTGSKPIAYQWQKSTTSATTGFTDIVGATGTTYDPSFIGQTTYYRVATTVEGGCTSSTGSCSAISNYVTVKAEIPVSNCFPTLVIKN